MDTLDYKTASMEADNLEAQWLNSENPEDFIRNNKNFNRLMMKYRCAIRELQTKLEVLDDEFSVAYQRNPISSIKARIKKPASIYDKLRRRGFPFTEASIVENLDDVAGVRVICPFIKDIYEVANLLTSQDDITVLKIKDYIENPKPNGYRSYHMIVEIPVFFSEGKMPMRAELQIRTIGMDFWASLDHQLHYKKDIGTGEAIEAIESELRKCAETVNETDRHMEEIKRMIAVFQTTGRLPNETVSQLSAYSLDGRPPLEQR